MSDDELLEYYEKYKDHQASVINLSLNLRDLVRLVHLFVIGAGDESECDATKADIDMYD